jgi:hypothetical protein
MKIGNLLLVSAVCLALSTSAVDLSGQGFCNTDLTPYCNCWVVNTDYFWAQNCFSQTCKEVAFSCTDGSSHWCVACTDNYNWNYCTMNCT